MSINILHQPAGENSLEGEMLSLVTLSNEMSSCHTDLEDITLDMVAVENYYNLLNRDNCDSATIHLSMLASESHLVKWGNSEPKLSNESAMITDIELAREGVIEVFKKLVRYLLDLIKHTGRLLTGFIAKLLDVSKSIRVRSKAVMKALDGLDETQKMQLDPSLGNLPGTINALNFYKDKTLSFSEIVDISNDSLKLFMDFEKSVTASIDNLDTERSAEEQAELAKGYTAETIKTAKVYATRFANVDISISGYNLPKDIENIQAISLFGEYDLIAYTENVPNGPEIAKVTLVDKQLPKQDSADSKEEANTTRLSMDEAKHALSMVNHAADLIKVQVGAYKDSAKAIAKIEKEIRANRALSEISDTKAGYVATIKTLTNNINTHNTTKRAWMLSSTNLANGLLKLVSMNIDAALEK